MKSYWIWIRQALVPLAATYVIPGLMLLINLIFGEVDLRNIAMFVMSYGMAFSILLSPMMLYNPAYLALSLGETRKGVCRGILMSRLLYTVLMAATGAPIIWYCKVVVNADFLLILLTDLGTLCSLAGIGGLIDCLLIKIGRKYVYLAIIILIFSMVHVVLLMIVGDFPFVAGIALAEGLILDGISVSLLRRTLNKWNVQL